MKSGDLNREVSWFLEGKGATVAINNRQRLSAISAIRFMVSHLFFRFRKETTRTSLYLMKAIHTSPSRVRLEKQRSFFGLRERGHSGTSLEKNS